MSTKRSLPRATSRTKQSSPKPRGRNVALLLKDAEHVGLARSRTSMHYGKIEGLIFDLARSEVAARGHILAELYRHLGEVRDDHTAAAYLAIRVEAYCMGAEL